MPAAFIDSQAEFRDEDVFEMFRAARRAGDSKEVEITLRVTPYSRSETLSDRVLRFAKQLAHLPNIRDEAGVFEVKGFNGAENHMDFIDLLQDTLFVSVDIRRAGQRTRVLDTEDAYRAIRAAYSDHRDELRAAAADLARQGA